MKKLRMKTLDAVDGNVAKIAALFPHCVTERKGRDGTPELAIDFDKLRAELSKDILDEGEERYQFTWPDKRVASGLANTSIDKTLRPDIKASKDFWDTENIYIEGDNLDVLKLLRENYLSKIKMIYIDPPYNTGKDFVYKDSRFLSQSEQDELEGNKDEFGNILFLNSDSNARFHTDWLNFMYARLKASRSLLSSDGVIFISIDDHEVDNLRKITSEIFGESNLIAEMIVNRTSEVATELTVQKHEYCLVYAKDINEVELSGDKKYTISRGTVGNLDQTMPIIEFPAGLRCVGIEDGVYEKAREIPNSLENIELITPMVIKNGFLSEAVKLKARWRSSNDMRNFFNNNCKPTKAKINGIIEEIFIEGTRLVPQIKKSVTEKIPTIFQDNRRGSKDLDRLDINLFDFPKSVDYVAFLIKLFTKENDIVLDFFSGSGTTAQSIFSLNANDKKNRKFILVQLPEEVDKTSLESKWGPQKRYSNLCELAEERIRRAGEKIKEEAGDKAKDLDIGFRVLKLDSSNMEDVFYTPEDFNEQDLFNYIDNVKSDRTPLDLLFQVLPELDIELSAKIEEREVNGKKVFFVYGTYLIATFDTDVNESTITEIARMQPQYFVMRDASAANDNVLDNFEQIFKHYSPETIRKIL